MSGDNPVTDGRASGGLANIALMPNSVTRANDKLSSLMEISVAEVYHMLPDMRKYNHMNPWCISDRLPDRTDCFIILSYAVRDRHMPVRPTRVLIEKAETLLRRFPEAIVILSTGDNQGLGRTNAAVMAEYGRRIGIPEDRIIQEGRSRNTYENLIFSQEIMQKRGLSHPTIIALDLHMRRAVAIARKLGWNDFRWISVFGRGEPAYGIKSFQTRSRATIFVYEILAWVYCRIRNQL